MTVKSAKKSAKRPKNSASSRGASTVVKKTGDLFLRKKLKNGLSVLLIENHKSPVVSVQMWVRTGSADEKKGEEGISHFIEHLVFKGTDRYGVGEIASTVEASGGELNAYTSFDQTVFYVNISREFADVGLDVIAQMMGFPKFDSQEIDNEREVVLEEIKRSNDSPGRQASRLLFSTAFKKHPYGIPVIGYDKIIKKVSRKVLTSYYQSRYIPKNMDLIIAGDFDRKAMAEKVAAIFGQAESFRLRPAKRAKEPAQTAPRLKIEKAPFEEAQFHMAWRVPGSKHKDVVALDVLAMILGQDDSSRLTRALRLESALVNSIGAGTFTPKDAGLFTVSASLNINQFSDVMAGVSDQILQLVREAPTAEELARAVVNLESDEFYGMETVEGLARKAGTFENLMGDHLYFKKFLKQVHALTPADLTRVARRYLGPKALNFVMMVPRQEKESAEFMKKWLKGYAREFALAAKAPLAKSAAKKLPRPAAPKARAAPDSAKTKALKSSSAATLGDFGIERHVLSSGASVLFREDRATPVVSAKAACLGGLRAEDAARGGATELLSRTWTSGTSQMNEAQLSSKIENIAAGLSAFGGRNSVGLSLQMIAPFEAQALDLFGEVLIDPNFDDAIVEREKQVMLEAIRSREDNPSQIVSQMFMSKMFEGHPYARDMYGTRESVAALKSSDIKTDWRKLVVAKNLTFSVCGAADRDKWIERLEAVTAKLPAGQPFAQSFQVAQKTTDEHQFHSLEREQSHIMMGFRGLTLSDSRRYTLQVIQSILSGQGGRLFIELRDKASLAYTVAPTHLEGLDTGYFGAYIGCTPSKGTKAIEMLNIEFEKLIETKVSDVELDRAKRYLIGRHDIDLQRNSSIATSLLFNEIYGIPAEEVCHYAERLREISADDVRELAAFLFKQNKLYTAVGPVCPW